ncbi:hypothetical protein DFH06DRAFT_1169998 [Mycena polygramma]|nr:hypothetical protein DFH06DRAFT_1169998 [Mycena polygramma]
MHLLLYIYAAPRAPCASAADCPSARTCSPRSFRSFKSRVETSERMGRTNGASARGMQNGLVLEPEYQSSSSMH